MSRKKKIAFDFDRVFVNYPPFIPSIVIDYLYKRRNHHLAYRIPGTIEKQIRILSHYGFFRPPIDENITALDHISKNTNSEIYIISSRFSFLRKRTEEWNKKHNIKHYFKKMFFNFEDEQPHTFKEKVIKREKIDIFVDDDLDLLLYLLNRNPKVKYFWITNNGDSITLPKGINKIKNLEEFIKKHV